MSNIAIYDFNNNYDDSSGNGYNLVPAGTVPFATTPLPYIYTYSAGVFSDANFYWFPAGLNTALSSQPYIFFQTYVYVDSWVTQPVIFYITIDGQRTFIELLNTGSVFFRWNAVTMQTAVNAIALKKWHYVALLITSGSADSKIWVSDASSVSSTPAVTNNFSTSIGTIANGMIGRYGLSTGLYLNGYMGNAWILNESPSAFPVGNEIPTLAASTISDEKVRLSWTDNPGYPSYTSWYNTVNDVATSSPFGYILGGTQQNDVCDLNSSTPYYFWLKRYSNLGNTDGTSSSATATTNPPSPSLGGAIINYVPRL